MTTPPDNVKAPVPPPVGVTYLQGVCYGERAAGLVEDGRPCSPQLQIVSCDHTRRVLDVERVGSQ